MNVTNYDPRKVSVVVDGRIVTGFADSSMITIARSEDIVSTSVGTQGDVVYSESANRSGTLTMSLQSYFDDMEDGIDATEKLLKEVESFLRKGK